MPCFWAALDSRGKVQPITHNLVERKQDGSAHTTWYTRCEGEGHKMKVFLVHMLAIIFANSLKEYEIITLIYNKKSCRLDLLFIVHPRI